MTAWLRNRVRRMRAGGLALCALVVPGGGQDRIPSAPDPAEAPGMSASAPAALEIVVRYPERNQRVVVDSNLVLGSVGETGATLSINGEAVDVGPGGAFLAWLEVPAPSRGDTAVYRLVARTAADSVELEHPVLRPPQAPPAGAPSPWVHPGGVGDLAERWMRPAERARLEFVAERGTTLRLEAGDVRLPVPSVALERGLLDRYAADIDLGRLREAACRTGACGRPGSGEQGPAPTVDTLPLHLVAERGGATRGYELRIPFALIAEAEGPGARLREAADPVNDRAGVVVARPTPFGPYRWRLADGSILRVTGRLGDRLRVALADGLEAWILVEDAEWSDPPREPARTRDARFTVAGAAGPEPVHVAPVSRDVVTFRVGLTRPVATQVIVTGERRISLTLYDTFAGMDRIAHGAGTAVAAVTWAQLPGPSVRIDLDLEWPVWGYRLAFETGDAAAYEGPRASRPAGGDGAPADSTVLRLDLRRPPRIDRDRPLSGRRVAIDPGHPGGGSTGPAGLFEGDANLAVARRLARLLEEEGAIPFLVRADPGPLGLYTRTRRAREAGADVLVSIHNNALPDGIRPFERVGTTTYYNHPHAAPLARAIQSELVARLRLRDLGVIWGDLAVAREPWMPSVLVEGAFMIVPEQEAALRTAEFQDAYARGVLEGIERYLAAFAEISQEEGVDEPR